MKLVDETIVLRSRCTVCPDPMHEGCRNSAREPHGCPFEEEINDDEAFSCTCCQDCERKCNYEI